MNSRRRPIIALGAGALARPRSGRINFRSVLASADPARKRRRQPDKRVARDRITYCQSFTGGMMKRVLQAVLALAALLPLAVAAQGYPDRPVKIIVPFPSGGPVDQLARELANGWSKALGQSFIVESKPGGNMTIGTAFVATSAPNGYTLLMGNSGGNIVTPALMTKPPYDGIKEFAPVGMALSTGNVLVIGPHVPATNLQQFIELLRAKPGQLSYGTPGGAGTTLFAAVYFERETKVKWNWVPYKGATPVINDLLGAHVDSAPLNVSAALPLIKSGRLRALAIASKTRAKALPDVPTFLELGIQDVSETWYGVLAAAGTPPAILQTLYTTMAKYLTQPEVRTRLEESGSEVFLLEPPKFLAFMLEEKPKLTKIAKSLGITLD